MESLNGLAMEGSSVIKIIIVIIIIGCLVVDFDHLTSPDNLFCWFSIDNILIGIPLRCIKMVF